MAAVVKAAPASISMIVTVRRVALSTLSMNVVQVSVRDHAARARAPDTPQAAHSVAVAQPRIRAEKISAMRRRTGNSFADCLSLNHRLVRGSGGGDLRGLRSVQTRM